MSFAIGGGRLTMQCNHRGCTESIWTTVIQNEPAKTGEKLVNLAKSKKWEHKKHLCPNHK